MGSFGYNFNSIDGDLYIQRLSSYIKKNEEALANGLLCFSKNANHKHVAMIKPSRLTFTIHHLYFLLDKLDQSSLDVDVGPLNAKLDINPNHEPTFISFMANNARGSKHFDSDTRSITSINSMRSIVSSASAYWRSFAISNDPKTIKKDLKYLYSSFTKIPCLILTPKTKVNSIVGYEEYPCDTSVPIKIFKNLQVLELVEYEPNEIFGWHILSEQLRILIIKQCKVTDLAEILFSFVLEDENGRSNDDNNNNNNNNNDTTTTTSKKRDLCYTYSSTGAGSLTTLEEDKSYNTLSEKKWSVLKQLTVSETSISRIPRYIFKPLVNLVKLNLSKNLLEEIPPGLDQLVSVKYLNFADNFIVDLKNLPNNLTHLLTLNLNNNKLINLEGLENIPSLEKIDLRRNNLSDIEALKPVVMLFKKDPVKLNNIYLSTNKLNKNYRIQLFNLFNGVKYKNTIKIDDSRPGYFEKAMLLDQEGASKCLQEFFHGHKRNNSASTLTNEEEATSNATLVSNSPVSKQEENIATLRDLQLDSNSPGSPSPSTTQRKQSSTLKKPKKFELSQTKLSAIPLSLLSQPSSPLYANHNISNKCDLSPASLKPSVHLNSSNSSLYNQASTVKRSTTLVDFEIHTAATNIVTPVQVTARMST